MPSGYTAGVASGEVTEFAEYALTCARAFGACVTLRDEPLSTAIPEFVASTHNHDAAVSAERKLAEFLAMTDEQLHALHSQESASIADDNEVYSLRQKTIHDRYEAMLVKAREFQAPSEDHEEYAQFLISQLEESMRLDCRSFRSSVPADFDTWKSAKIQELTSMIRYHKQAHVDEIDRTAKRNLWVQQLKSALGVK